MARLPLVMAPHPIFKQQAQAVDKVDDAVRLFMDNLLETLYHEEGIGIAAPMVGVLQRIVIVDLQEDKQKAPLFCVNPVITMSSDTTQAFTEASLCFPGISAVITRPQTIGLRYVDYDGKPQEMTAEGFLATCLQHEIDYLNGITFLDHLSLMKRDMLLRKMKKIRSHA